MYFSLKHTSNLLLVDTEVVSSIWLLKESFCTNLWNSFSIFLGNYQWVELLDHSVDFITKCLNVCVQFYKRWLKLFLKMRSFLHIHQEAMKYPVVLHLYHCSNSGGCEAAFHYGLNLHCLMSNYVWQFCMCLLDICMFLMKCLLKFHLFYWVASFFLSF